MNRFTMTRWFGCAIVIALTSGPGSVVLADAGTCGAVRVGETMLTIVENAPIITLFANGAAIALLVDTGAQTTILAPDAAQRVGARRPRIEFPREMQGIAGSLQTGEVELQ